MKYITRFNPSTSGGLHVGHVFVARLNEQFALDSNGQFFVRIVDDYSPGIEVYGAERCQRQAEGYVEDLNWLGFQVDEYQYESAMVEEARRLLRERFHYEPLPELPHVMNYRNTPVILTRPDVLTYPHTPTITAEKVVMDWMTGTNLLVRGLDLLTEFSLYEQYCRMFGVPEPQQFYVDRLTYHGQDMSKHGGAMQLGFLRRQGYSAQDIEESLRIGCLANPLNGWRPYNLKREPTFNL